MRANLTDKVKEETTKTARGFPVKPSNNKHSSRFPTNGNLRGIVAHIQILRYAVEIWGCGVGGTRHRAQYRKISVDNFDELRLKPRYLCLVEVQQIRIWCYVEWLADLSLEVFCMLKVSSCPLAAGPTQPITARDCTRLQNATVSQHYQRSCFCQ